MPTSSSQSRLHLLVAPCVALATFLTCQLPLWSAAPSDRRPRVERYIESLEAERPHVVFIGNSLLKQGLDRADFTAATGLPAAVISRGGTASAWWYLALKNVVGSMSPLPAQVVILSRDTMLTQPSFRVRGAQRAHLDELSRGAEPTLRRLAYPSTEDKLRSFAETAAPVIVARQAISMAVKRTLDERFLGAMFAPPSGSVRGSLRQTFDERRMVPELLGAVAGTPERDGHRASLDFPSQVGSSFLPEMVAIAKRAGIQLRVVRFKAARDVAPGQQSEELQAYVASLRAWLTERDVDFHDFSDDPRLRAEHYRAGDHLNAAGREIFTTMLAELFAPP